MNTKPPVSAQAEVMIRRVSPEGRAQAQRERERRQRITARLARRVALVAIVIGSVAWGMNVLLTPIGTVGIVAAGLLFFGACIAIGFSGRERPAALTDLVRSKLDELPRRVETWVDRHRPLLPQPTGRLLDSISVRLRDLEHQLARLDGNGVGEDAVRRLLATELPALIAGYLGVPVSMRSQTGNGGQSADTHLLHGLTAIDSEICRMTEQLARGAFDELATQNRFLELKYEGAGDFR